MVDLTLERPGNHLYIRSVGEAGIQVVDEWYSQSILIAADRLVPDWSLQRIGELEREHLAAIFELDPEVVIIGTGERQHFLPPELMMEFHGQGIGAEVMSTAAACRTFNVLVSEGRKVVAALLPPSNREP